MERKVYLVVRRRIIGTDIFTHSAYETGQYPESHSVWRHYEGVWVGDVSMRSIPAAIAAMPVGDARRTAVHAWYDGLEEKARDIVLTAYPEIRDMSGIENVGGDLSYCVPGAPQGMRADERFVIIDDGENAPAWGHV